MKISAALPIYHCTAPARPLWRRLFCAIRGHRWATTHTHLITGDPIYRQRTCIRCGRRTVEILRD